VVCWHWRSSLEELTGQKITADGLAEAIRKVNAKRRSVRRLAELRKADLPPISGRDALLIYQVAFYDDVERFTAQVNALCDELEERVRRGVGMAPPGTPRLVVTGTPMAIPKRKSPAALPSKRWSSSPRRSGGTMRNSGGG